MRGTVAAVLEMVGWCLLFVAFAGRARAEDAGRWLFDRPVKVVVHRSLLSKHYFNGGSFSIYKTVTCSYFPDFIVKVVDDQKIGAQLSTIMINRGVAPPCEDGAQAGEYVIPWTGYFYGAKDGLAVFTGADGVNDGIAAIFFRPSDRKIIFADMFGAGGARLDLKAVRNDRNGLLLQYGRSVDGSCSVASDGQACVLKLAKQMGVEANFLIFCQDQYVRDNEFLARARCASEKSKDPKCFQTEMQRVVAQGWNSSPSSMVYDVDVFVPAGAPAFDKVGAYFETEEFQLRSAAYITKRGAVTACDPQS